MADKENLGKSSSDEFSELLDKLTIDQIRFVVARQQFASDKEAAEEVGVKPNTVYGWRHDGAPIDKAIRMLASDGIVLARHILRQNLAKAMLVKVGGLDEDDEQLRQRVATEIIEWQMGKAKQGFEHTGPDGGEVTIRVVYEDEPDRKAKKAA